MGNMGGWRGEWRELMDGRIYQLRKGEDFSCTELEFAKAARAAAERCGKGLKMAKLQLGGGVVLRAVPYSERDPDREILPESPLTDHDLEQTQSRRQKNEV